MPRPIVILGAGLAGLSAAYQAKKAGKAALLFEAQSRPGGLVRSERVNGFTFDYTGHLLHLREPRTQALVNDELGLRAKFAPVQRDSWVYANQRFTRAPYQANLYGQPLSVVHECLQGVLQAHGVIASPAPFGGGRGPRRQAWEGGGKIGESHACAASLVSSVAVTRSPSSWAA
jgi:protoporphyrinogen oxidase